MQRLVLDFGYNTGIFLETRGGTPCFMVAKNIKRRPDGMYQYDAPMYYTSPDLAAARLGFYAAQARIENGEFYTHQTMTLTGRMTRKARDAISAANLGRYLKKDRVEVKEGIQDDGRDDNQDQ